MMEFRGHHLRSEVCSDPHGPERAWDSFLGRLADLVRACPDSRFVWRASPYLERVMDFPSNTHQWQVFGRVVECIGGGEPPLLIPAKYEDMVGGLGLASIV